MGSDSNRALVMAKHKEALKEAVEQPILQPTVEVEPEVDNDIVTFWGKISQQKKEYIESLLESKLSLNDIINFVNSQDDVEIPREQQIRSFCLHMMIYLYKLSTDKKTVELASLYNIFGDVAANNTNGQDLNKDFIKKMRRFFYSEDITKQERICLYSLLLCDQELSKKLAGSCVLAEQDDMFKISDRTTDKSLDDAYYFPTTTLSQNERDPTAKMQDTAGFLKDYRYVKKAFLDVNSGEIYLLKRLTSDNLSCTEATVIIDHDSLWNSFKFYATPPKEPSWFEKFCAILGFGESVRKLEEYRIKSQGQATFGLIYDKLSSNLKDNKGGFSLLAKKLRGEKISDDDITSDGYRRRSNSTLSTIAPVIESKAASVVSEAVQKQSAVVVDSVATAALASDKVDHVSAAIQPLLYQAVNLKEASLIPEPPAGRQQGVNASLIKEPPEGQQQGVNASLIKEPPEGQQQGVNASLIPEPPAGRQQGVGASEPPDGITLVTESPEGITLVTEPQSTGQGDIALLEQCAQSRQPDASEEALKKAIDSGRCKKFADPEKDNSREISSIDIEQDESFILEQEDLSELIDKLHLHQGNRFGCSPNSSKVGLFGETNRKIKVQDTDKSLVQEVQDHDQSLVQEVQDHAKPCSRGTACC